jgi:phytoene synthase
MSASEAAALCAATVRLHDRDRFAASLCAPARQRAALWALYAFNYEIARTREVVTDLPLGRIRLQWWREAVDEALRPQPQFHHEILRPLADSAAAYALPAEMFHALIDAREGDMDPAAVAGLDALQSYAVATNLPLLRMAARIGGADEHAAALPAVAGGYGLVGLLRAHASHSAHGAMIAADTADVHERAGTLLAAAGRPGGQAGALAAVARIYLARLPVRGPGPAPFLLLRLFFSRR